MSRYTFLHRNNFCDALINSLVFVMFSVTIQNIVSPLMPDSIPNDSKIFRLELDNNNAIE